MFAGLLGTLYKVLSHLWLPGGLLILAGTFGRYRFPNVRKFAWALCLQWGCLLLCVAFAWQSVDQILLGILQNGEKNISIGMFRFLLIVFPVLLIQIMVFLRRDIQVWKHEPRERLSLIMLGIGVFAGFYSTVLAYTLADAETITNCLYMAPKDYRPDVLNSWAQNVCE